MSTSYTFGSIRVTLFMPTWLLDRWSPIHLLYNFFFIENMIFHLQKEKWTYSFYASNFGSTWYNYRLDKLLNPSGWLSGLNGALPSRWQMGFRLTWVRSRWGIWVLGRCCSKMLKILYIYMHNLQTSIEKELWHDTTSYLKGDVFQKLQKKSSHSNTLPIYWFTKDRTQPRN